MFVQYLNYSSPKRLGSPPPPQRTAAGWVAGRGRFHPREGVVNTKPLRVPPFGEAARGRVPRDLALEAIRSDLIEPISRGYRAQRVGPALLQTDPI